MFRRTTKLRWRRRFRRSKKQVEDIGFQAEEHLEQHLFKRLSRLSQVRRFVICWLLLVALLAGMTLYQTSNLEKHYLSLQPAAGGTFVEGIQGAFTNANPLYATNSVDAAVSRLVFASLFKYNQNNNLVGDLAKSWSTDKRGTTYTVTLKDNLSWQDSKPLTAADVVFTYKTIQNPDAKSPLSTGWRNVQIKAKSRHVIIFKLPSALSSFPHALTNGIVPKHLLSGIPMAQLRGVAFNTSAPVGAGPFKWNAIENKGDSPDKRIQRIGLSANEDYHSGKPQLSGFVINVFRESKTMIDSFKKHELNAMVGLSELPEELDNKLIIEDHSIPLAGEALIFFKTKSDILSDQNVRRALAMSVDTNEARQTLGYPVIKADEPLLKGQLGYNPKLKQLGTNIKAAEKLLQKSGWTVGKNGIRVKGKKQLSFRLYSQSNSEYSRVIQSLQKQWRAVGVDAQVFLRSSDSLQNIIGNHRYDALLYGITIGVDPDVFAYWHSSQADIRSSTWLNFSEYKSTDADAALEAGRNRQNPKVREIKYAQFLKAWRTDAPAIALYQPRFLYVTRGQVFNFTPKILNIGIDRFANVENWMINQQKLPI